MRLIVAAALALLAAPACAIELSSPDVKDGASFDTRFVCPQYGGQGISPALEWTGVPAAARSLAVTIHDPDAPVAGGFWHWLTVDIPATATGLEQGAGSGGSLPAGATALPNGSKKPGYIGPCPPAGPAHHYDITVWALPEANAGVTADMAPGDVGAWLEKNAVDKATITPVFASP